MKTKTVVFRFLAGLLVVALINIQGLSQEKEDLKTSETIFILLSSAFNQPILIENTITLEDWMIKEDFVDRDSEDNYFIEYWMLDVERLDDVTEEINFISDWMLDVGFDLINDVKEELLDWMIEFEPFVVEELLIQVVDYPEIESWMLNGRFALDFDFNEVDFRDWMIECFGMN